jgi:hypothetical protein
MGNIDVTNYKQLATYYTNAASQLTGISDHYYNAAYLIVQLSVFDPEIDLLIPFHNAYLASEGSYGTPIGSAVKAVKKLQDHILARGISNGLGLKDDGVTTQTAGDKYLSINEYYADEEATDAGAYASQLDQEFANISLLAGHEISSTYIA